MNVFDRLIVTAMVIGPLLLVPAPASAQADGTIIGTVTDQTQAVLPGVGLQ